MPSSSTATDPPTGATNRQPPGTNIPAGCGWEARLNQVHALRIKRGKNKRGVHWRVSVTDTFNILPFPSDQSARSYLCDWRRSDERRMSGRVPTAPRKGGTTRACKQSTHTRKFTVSHIWRLTLTEEKDPLKYSLLIPPATNTFIYPQDFLRGRDVIYTSPTYLTNIWTVIACVYQSLTFFIFFFLFLFNLTQQYPDQDEGISQIRRHAKVFSFEN